MVPSESIIPDHLSATIAFLGQSPGPNVTVMDNKYY